MIPRGQMSPFMIGFLLALIGFVILAAALLPQFFNQGSLPDRESCHLSVLSRGTVPLGQEALPLRCTTDKVCITGDLFGNCAQFAGEKNVRRVRVTTTRPEDAARIIERETANAMYDCWSMMGEGKLDIFAHEDIGTGLVNTILGTQINFQVTQPKCVICTRVAVDVSSVPSTITERVDVNRYIAKELVPGQSLTYLNKFTDRQVAAYAGAESPDLSKGIPTKTNDLAILFMQIKTPNDPTKAFEDVAAGSFIVGGTGLLTSTGRFVATKLGWPLALVYLAGTGATAGFASYTAHESQLISAGFCGEFVTNEDKKLGCSIVRPVSWNAADINRFCGGGIEGNL